MYRWVWWQKLYFINLIRISVSIVQWKYLRNVCRLAYSPILIRFSLFFLKFIQQLCRNSTASTPMMGLSNAITGASYKEPFPNTARALSTSSVRRDIDSASKFIGAGVATVGTGISSKFFCEEIQMKPTQNENESNFDFFSFCWLCRYRRRFHFWQFDDELCPKSIAEGSTVQLCDSGFRIIGSIGPILLHGGASDAVWIVNMWISTICLIAHVWKDKFKIDFL